MPSTPRSGFAFGRTRRAIDRDEIVQIPQSRAEPLLAAAIAIAVLIFCINLVPIRRSRRDSTSKSIGKPCDGVLDNGTP
jgi:hypothetical protein